MFVDVVDVVVVVVVVVVVEASTTAGVDDAAARLNVKQRIANAARVRMRLMLPKNGRG